MCVERIWLYKGCQHSSRSRADCEGARRQSRGWWAPLFGSSDVEACSRRFETHYDLMPCQQCQRAARERSDREAHDRAGTRNQAREAAEIYGWSTGGRRGAREGGDRMNHESRTNNHQWYRQADQFQQGGLPQPPPVYETATRGGARGTATMNARNQSELPLTPPPRPAPSSPPPPPSFLRAINRVRAVGEARGTATANTGNQSELPLTPPRLAPSSPPPPSFARAVRAVTRNRVGRGGGPSGSLQGRPSRGI